MDKRGWAGSVLVAWLVLSSLPLLAYVRAERLPPAGHLFVGFFYFVDDHYNYLSYVEQARRGQFRFENKVVLEPHSPALVNLEWWLVGRIAATLGDRPFLAYRLVGALATLGLLAAVAGWLERLGFPEKHRTAALLLVGAGGGPGGPLVHLGLRSFGSNLDLTTGLFPFVGILGNPHFTVGTALLLWGLGLLCDAKTTTARLGAVTAGSVLALVRPYDFVLLVAIRGLGVFVTEPRSRWYQSLGLLAAFAPVVAYNYWIFYRNPAFSFYGQAPYIFPPRLDLLLALAPAGVLAALGVFQAMRSRPACTPRTHLVLWSLLGAAVIAVRPVHFSLQFLVGVGAPLLILGSLALGAARPGWFAATTAAFSASALAAFALCVGSNPRWFIPSPMWDTVVGLEKTCQPEEVLVAPAPIGLYATGLSACRAVVSHGIAPDHLAREAAVLAFYSEPNPTARARFLDRVCASRLVLPGDAGPTPVGWLGAETPFRRSAALGADSGGTVLTLYSRPRPPGCRVEPFKFGEHAPGS